MRATLIRTVPRATINALAYQGIIPCENYTQIRDTLLRHFGERHAAPFAEPVANKNEGFIDWYVPFEGNVRPYATLDDTEKQAASEQFSKLAADIRAYAQELIAIGDPQKVTRGSILEMALSYPSEEDLFLVDDTPVVTCWGFASGSQGAPICNLCDLRVITPKTQPPKPEDMPAEADKPAEKQQEEKRVYVFWALPWLLPLLLLLLLLVLLFSDFGKMKALSGHSYLSLPSLFAPEEEKEAALSLRIHDLDAERIRLEGQAQALIAQCRRKMPSPSQEVPEQRSTAPSKPVTPIEQIKEQLVIPDNVRDTSFLRGRWLCDTGLVNAKTNQPVTVEFVFDAKGVGAGRIYEGDDVCVGAARATLDKGVLHIEHDPLRCAGSDSAYTANAIECRNTERGATECRGRSSHGTKWKASFLRLHDSTLP